MKQTAWEILKAKFPTIFVAFRSVMDKDFIDTGSLHLRPSGSVPNRAYIRVPEVWAVGAYVDANTLEAFIARARRVITELNVPIVRRWYEVVSPDGKVIEGFSIPAGATIRQK